MSALRQRDAADATNKTMAMRYELSAVLREVWTSRALVPGACVFAYIVASLLIVVMNKVVLDTYQFPSTTIILSLQLAATLASVMGFVLWVGWPRERRRRVYGAVQTKGPSDRTLVKAAAPPLALLFLLDVGLGHVASKELGLDAFAAFRRFNIPIAMHLEVFMRMAPWNRKIALATWVMVLGPLMAVLLGRGRSTSAYETAAGLPSDILDQAHVFSGATATDRVVVRNATRYVITKSHGAARFEALSFDGCAAALCSACVAALRVVALRHVLLRHRSQADAAQGRVWTERPRGIGVEEEAARALLDDDTSQDSDSDVELPIRPIAPPEKPIPSTYAFAGLLLAVTTALCLPCVVVAGAFLERTGVEKALTDTTLSLGFLMRFLFLIFLGPTHEVAIYACVLHNPALTTLVASGFKYTALGAYHALLVKLPGEAEQDEWDYLGTAVTALASAVYTVEWFRAATRPAAGPSVAVGLHAPPPQSPEEDARKPRRVRSSDQFESPWWARSASVELVDRGRFGSVVRL